MTRAQARERFGPPSFAFNAAGLRSMRFECRPVSIAGDGSTVGFAYRLEGNSLKQSGVCVFRDGCWRDPKGVPLEGDYYWAAAFDE